MGASAQPWKNPHYSDETRKGIFCLALTLWSFPPAPHFAILSSPYKGIFYYILKNYWSWEGVAYLCSHLKEGVLYFHYLLLRLILKYYQYCGSLLT